MGVNFPDFTRLKTAVVDIRPEESQNDEKFKGIDFAQVSIEHYRLSLIKNVSLLVLCMIVTLGVSRWLVVKDFALIPLSFTCITVLYLASIWYRLQRKKVITFVGEKVTAIICFWILGLSYLSGGLVGPFFPFLAVLPLIAIELSGRKAGIIILCFLSAYIPFMYFLSIMFPQFATLKVSPEQLFMMRSIVMLLATAVVGTLGWYFTTINRKLLTLVSEQANTDYLTGLLNRRALESVLSKELKRAKRNGSSLSVIIIDIDDFKIVNDTYGHQVGDDCLQHLSSIIATSIHRSADSAGRYGGEEFVMVLPETDAEGGLKVAENLRKAIMTSPLILADNQVLPMTISLGVCSTYNCQQSNGDQLLKEADRMLYKSKAAGKNQVKGTVLEENKKAVKTIQAVAV